MTLKQNQFYCVGCQKPVSCYCETIKIKKDKNGRPRMVSKCKNEHKLFKYIKESDVNKLHKKYNN
jgi:hypothetical protein